MKTIESTSALFLILFFVSYGAFAQKSSTISLDAYVDTYYASYNDPSTTSNFQRFSTVAPRDKSIGLNMAMLTASYKAKNVRTTATFHSGDIQRATWDRTFPFIQEANIGIHLFPDWWLDVGLFTTHIGTESFLPKNNLLSTTSIITFNEPFFQSGAKLAYEGSDKFDLEFWLVNGYNQFTDENSAKSYGLLFTYNISDKLSFTYTNLFGRESSDNAPTTDFISYQNLYLNADTKYITLALGTDFSTSTRKFTNSGGEEVSSTDVLVGLLATIRVKFTDKLSLTSRFESLNDDRGYITGTYPIEGTQEVAGIDMYGITGGIEYAPTDASYMRFETRYLQDRNSSLNVFPGESGHNRTEFVLTVGHAFSKEW